MTTEITSTTTHNPDAIEVHIVVRDELNKRPIQFSEVSCSQSESFDGPKTLTDKTGEAICGFFDFGSTIFIRCRHSDYQDIDEVVRLYGSVPGFRFRFF
jgi:hypothetical protein